MSRVTASIVTYPGGEKYLQEAIDSINDQTYKDFELIVVNDDRNTTLKWNDLIDNCKSEYLWLFHHDDVALPSFLEKMVAALDAQPTAAAAFCYDYVIDGNGNRIRETNCPLPPRPLYEYKEMTAYGGILRCPSVVLRVPLIGDLRFNLEEGNTANDLAMWFKILSRHPIVVLPDKLYLYREHEDSDTRKNVLTSDKIWDGVVAWDFGLKLKPHESSWQGWASVGRMNNQRERVQDEIRVKRLSEVAGKINFCVAHEAPENAGTGVLVADRVRGFNRGDEEITYYVCPVPGNSVALGWEGGCPVIKCPPEAFGAVVDKYKPKLIEFHHTLRWPIEILATPAPCKKLYLHDSHLWCARWHMVDRDYKVCDGPGADKCAACAGIPALEVSSQKEILEKLLPGLDGIYANSEYTAGMASRVFPGVNIEVHEFPIPELPVYRKRVRIGYFGGFYPVKGVDTLLDAMIRVKWAQLLLFCDVPPDFTNGRRLNGFDNVMVMGRYNRSDLPYLTNLVDFAVVPSVNESYGLVGRELEMLGVHCIKTHTGGQTGTIPPGDVDALAREIQEAVDAWA